MLRENVRIGLRFAGCLVSLLFPLCVGAQTVVEHFNQQSTQPEPGRCVWLNVDQAPQSVLLRPTVSAGGQTFFYPMEFNQVAEGWSWHEGPKDAEHDAFDYQYLPLLSTDEDRGQYRFEDKIGEAQNMRSHWHYCLLYTSPSPRDATLSRMPSSA